MSQKGHLAFFLIFNCFDERKTQKLNFNKSPGNFMQSFLSPPLEMRHLLVWNWFYPAMLYTKLPEIIIFLLNIDPYSENFHNHNSIDFGNCCLIFKSFTKFKWAAVKPILSKCLLRWTHQKYKLIPHNKKKVS